MADELVTCNPENAIYGKVKAGMLEGREVSCPIKLHNKAVYLPRSQL